MKGFEMSPERYTWFLLGRKERGSIISGENRQIFGFCLSPAILRIIQASVSCFGTDIHFCHIIFEFSKR